MHGLLIESVKAKDKRSVAVADLWDCWSNNSPELKFMSTELPVTLFTAIGVFQGGPDWIVKVAVPNFPTQEDAEAYASAFRVKLVDGKLYRDDGKGLDISTDHGAMCWIPRSLFSG